MAPRLCDYYLEMFQFSYSRHDWSMPEHRPVWKYHVWDPMVGAYFWKYLSAVGEVRGNRLHVHTGRDLASCVQALLSYTNSNTSNTLPS